MTRPLYRTLRIVLVLLATALASGCALTTDTVSFHYVAEPQHEPPSIDETSGDQQIAVQAVGAQSVGEQEGPDLPAVSLSVIDARPRKNQISHKMNGYGMETAPIVSSQDIPSLFRMAIADELRVRGYEVTDSDLEIGCEVQEFYNSWRAHLLSGDAIANVRMVIKIRDAEGRYLFSEMITGSAEKTGIQLTSGANAKAALDLAFRDCMQRLFARKDFYDAIQTAADSRAAAE